jgi:hypothetical protein
MSSDRNAPYDQFEGFVEKIESNPLRNREKKRRRPSQPQLSRKKPSPPLSSRNVTHPLPRKKPSPPLSSRNVTQPLHVPRKKPSPPLSSRNVTQSSPQEPSPKQQNKEADPAPQLMITGLDLLEKGKELKNCTEEERLIVRLRDDNGPVATRIKKEWLEPAIQANRTFEELVDLSLQNKPLESFELEEVEKAWKAVGLGDKKMKSPQDRVCWEIAKSGSDVIFTAPCGFGKSACFAVPAVMSGGMTLVVVPLRTLADSLEYDLGSLNSTSFDVEQLLNADQAKAQSRKSCSSRLHELLNLSFFSKPKILITVLERIDFQTTLHALSQLCDTKRHEMGRLTRIVLDEFDYVDECTRNFRESYLDIFKTLRSKCQRGLRPIQIVCMSATASLHAVQLSREGSSSRSKAVCLHADRILPDHHSYYCERRMSDKQASDLLFARTYVADLALSHDSRTGLGSNSGNPS